MSEQKRFATEYGDYSEITTLVLYNRHQFYKLAVIVPRKTQQKTKSIQADPFFFIHCQLAPLMRL